MNTTLIENKKDYYEDYYPSSRIEKAIFNYLDQDYYTSEDGVFFTIYKKENDWFVNKSDIEDEIKSMFGLTLPDRIKVGQDDYIEPARNPIPKRVIQNWVNNHLELKAHKEAMVHDKKKNSLERRNDRGIEEDLENWGFDGKEIGPLSVREQKNSDEEKERKDRLTTLKAQIDTNDSTIKKIEKQIKDLEDKDGETSYFGDKDKEKKSKGPVIGILEVDDETKLSTDVRNAEIKALKSNIDAYNAENNYLNKQKKDLSTPKPIKTDSTPTMDSDKDDEKTDTPNTSTTGTKKPIKISKIVDKDGVLDQSIVGVTEQEEPEFDEFSDEELEKRRTYDDFSDEEKREIDQEHVDMTPFKPMEVKILKTLHKNLDRSELQKLSTDTPEAYGGLDKKFWDIMKLFGISVGTTEENTRVSRYAKWALDNWNEEGDYNIENPIKVPLKWYGVERDESGSQVEYKSGNAEVLGFDSDDAGERADYDFYAWGGEMETNDYGDYESYDSQVTNSDFLRMDEQKENKTSYLLNPESDSPVLNVQPVKIAQKFSDVNGYGQIKFNKQGGNGIAYFTDKNLVIKLTSDVSEYQTANKLIGLDNEYIVKVIESAQIKTSHSNFPFYVIVEEALPMTQEMEQKWLECCCGVDSPIHIDYLEQPVLVLPPVSNYDLCTPIYDDIVGIQKNFKKYGVVWGDIGIDNLGVKNGKLVVIDLGNTIGGSVKGNEIFLTLENIKIRPLTKKQINKQKLLI